MSADSTKSPPSSDKPDRARFDRPLLIAIAVAMVVLLALTSAILAVVVSQDSDASEGSQQSQVAVGATTTTLAGTAGASPGGLAPDASGDLSAEMVEVPFVVWSQESLARTALAGLGLGWTTTYQPGKQNDWGAVCSQYPNAGTMVPAGSIVELWVITEGITVPDVVGQGKDEATASLASVEIGATYVYKTTTNSAKWGIVMDQWVYGGMMVLPGESVELTIGKKPFQMPTTTTLIQINVPSGPLVVP